MSEHVGGVTDLIGLRRVSAELIYPHVFENADREVGGVLVGRTPQDGGLPLVTGAIAALRADERRATLTFTQDAWEHVHRTLDLEFPPDEQIVGWYHSHPGFGIFLSEHDLFIHRNFFSGPSQVALVVDPLAQTEGVFIWEREEIGLLFERPTPSGWQAAAVSAPPPVPQAAPLQPAAASYPLLALVVAGVLGLGAGFGVERVLVGGDDARVPTVTKAVQVRPGGTTARRRRRPPLTTSTPSTTVQGANPYARGQAEIDHAKPAP